MSQNDAGTPAEQNSTPYLQPDDPRDVSKDGADLEAEPATMDPAEEMRIRRDLQLGFENFEQGIQG